MLDWLEAFANIDMWLLYGLLVVFFIISLILLINMKFKGLFFVIPVVAFFVTSGIYTYQSILGQPTTKVIPEKFYILHYVADEQQKKIFLWLREDGVPHPMSYVIPYTRLEHKQLHRKTLEAQKSKGAKGIRGKRKLREDNRYGLEIEAYKFVDQKNIRKDGVDK